MWERLRQADIALAKQQLRQRVDETLLRQLEELKRLDKEQSEIEALNRLLDEFSRKFKKAPGGRAEPASADPVPAEAAPAGAAADESGLPEAETPEAEPAEATAEEAECAEAAAEEGEASDPAPADPAPEGDEPAEVEADPADMVAKANRAAADNAADKAPPKGRNAAEPREREPNQRPKPRTNFDAFSQAMSKIDRW